MARLPGYIQKEVDKRLDEIEKKQISIRNCEAAIETERASIKRIETAIAQQQEIIRRLTHTPLKVVRTRKKAAAGGDAG